MSKPRIERAYEILKTYTGPNRMIKWYRSKYEAGQLILDEFQRDYIIENHDYEPFSVNRIVRISPELGKELYEKYATGFIPDRVRILDVIGEMKGTYHCYTQYRNSVPPKLMFLKKKYLLSELKIVNPDLVEVDFDQFDKMTEGDGRRLKEHQKSAVKFLLANQKCILADSMGLGKALVNSTLIPIPGGFKPVGEIEVGDLVYGSDGKTYPVRGVFHHKDKSIWTIRFKSHYHDTTVECCEDHLWIARRKYNNHVGYWEVISTKQIWEALTHHTDEELCTFEIPHAPLIEGDIIHNNHWTGYDYPIITEIIKGDNENTADMTCISVDSPDHSYLCTENYIVTHNTTSSIVASMAADAKKVLIITTASLKSTWKRELMLYNDESDIEIVKAGKKWKQNARFTIVNYELVKNFYKVPQEQAIETQYLKNADGTQTEVRVPVYTKDKKTGQLKPKMVKSRKNATIAECMAESPLYQMKFDCVIVDEAQKLSNHTSIRYKVIEDFIKRSGVRYAFLLTGTPLTNNPVNLYRILRLLDAPITDDYNFYCQRYCGGYEMKLRTGKKVMITNGATHLDELRDRIKHLYIRRLISDLPDMVHKEISTRYYDLDERQQRKYEELWNEYVEAQRNVGKEDTDSYRQLVEGMLVRQYLAKEMIPNTIQLVDEIIEDGEKAIIVCTFQDELDKFKEHYKDKCVCYDGRMSAAQKDEAEKAFMTDPKVKVFVGNINAASLGLTLTIAKKMVFNSYSWEEITNRQMQDRIWRITQTEDVECIYQLFTDSISQHMFNSVIRKGMIMDEVIKSENDKKK